MFKFLFKKSSFLLPVLVSGLILPVIPVSADTGADAILGEWLTQKKDSKVTIYKQGGLYFGKITWLKEPNKDGKPKVDDKNPDKSKQNKPIMGMNLLRDFKFVKANRWEGGQIYNPRDGKEYNCNITLKDAKTLDVRGYVGISLIGKTEVWSR